MPRMKSNDKTWADLNNRLLAAIQQNNWNEMKTIYYEQALLIKKEEGDSFRFIEESLKSELHQDQDAPTAQVEILAPGDSCPECHSLNGRAFNISEAVTQCPVPNSNCSRESCR